MREDRRNLAYVPALGFRALSGFYDPLIRVWSAARKFRSAVIEALDVKPGMRLLELGCGSGRLAIEIKRLHPAAAIDALELDRGMIGRARRNAERAGVDIRFHQANIVRPPALGRFDRVYSTMVFHHLRPEDKTLALAGAHRQLQPGGRFVVVDFGRPRDLLQALLFRAVQQPLDGVHTTAPHYDGRYEREVRRTFSSVTTARVWRTAGGTLELFVCTP